MRLLEVTRYEDEDEIPCEADARLPGEMVCHRQKSEAAVFFDRIAAVSQYAC